jgi:tRNA G37 N-methylase TrmD
MRDKRIRYRPLEYLALREAGVGAFVFTGGTVTASETAGVVVRILTKFVNMAASEPRPFLRSALPVHSREWHFVGRNRRAKNIE